MGLVEATIGGLKVCDLSHVYDPERRVFYDVVRDRDGRAWVDPAASNVCYTNDDMVVWVYPQTIATIQKVMADPSFGRVPRRIPFVNGIWGSGKTFLGKAWFNEMRSRGNTVMFVGASRIPTDDVRTELFGEDPIGKKFVRTFGSLLANPGGAEADMVVFDEVCIEHAAVLFLSLWLIQPRQFWACGDFGQMYYVPFLAGFKPKYGSIVQYSDIAMLIEGHRVPLDVYPAGLEIYGKDSGIHPCACPDHQRIEESLSVVRVSNIAEIPLSKDVTCLSHGQTTKDRVKGLVSTKFGNPKQIVSTIVEFQGGTTGEVAAIREVVPHKVGTIYHQLERANVGISRSVGKTTYYTCSSEQDAIVKLVEASKKLEYRDIIQENIKNLRGKATFGVKELVAFIEGRLSENHPSMRAGKKFKESRC